MLDWEITNARDIEDQYHGRYIKFIYDCLKERLKEPIHNISHKMMPTWNEHIHHLMEGDTYLWYDVIINSADRTFCIGYVYCTINYEVGIYIREGMRGQGYGSAVLKKIFDAYPFQSFLANINPANKASIKMFEKLGFTHIQNTYRKPPKLA